jgi:hypothetical protein
MTQRYLQPNNNNTQWFVRANTIIGNSNENITIAPDNSNNVGVVIDCASYLQIPTGVSNERPAAAYNGMIRYTTSDNTIEYYSEYTGLWSGLTPAPSLISINPNFYNLNTTDSSFITLTGSNFLPSSSVEFIGQDFTTYTVNTLNFLGSTTLSALIPSGVITDGSTNEPYSVRVNNASLFSTLNNVFFINNFPVFVDPVSNSILNIPATILDSCQNILGSSIKLLYDLSAIDQEEQHYPLTYNSDISSVIGPLLTLDTSGGSASNGGLGVVTGITPMVNYPTVSTTFTFNATATDTSGAVSDSTPYRITIQGYNPFTFTSTSNATILTRNFETDKSTITTSTNPEFYGYTEHQVLTTANLTSGSTNFNPSFSNFVEFLCVAGGGAGGGITTNGTGCGGGGAGGFITGYFYVTSGSNYAITVGKGGTGVADTGGDGGNSSVFGYTTIGGGGGGTRYAVGRDGGSGGGSGSEIDIPIRGQSTTFSQGTCGGTSQNFSQGPYYPGAGGGGAGRTGADANMDAAAAAAAGLGGDGLQTDLSGGILTYFAGGGGGGLYNDATTSPGRSGGQGGGGAGGVGTALGGSPGTQGTQHYGGGGGGSSHGPSGSSTGAAGGAGIVILRHLSFPLNLYEKTVSVGSGLTYQIIYLNSSGSQNSDKSYSGPQPNGYTIYRFTNGTGTITPSATIDCSYVVIGGGGGGGTRLGGGGGAGAFRDGSITLTGSTGVTATVGNGGAGGSTDNSGAKGSDSVLSTITSEGGGYGAGFNETLGGGSGGSGGGGMDGEGGRTTAGGICTSGSYGNNGGSGGFASNKYLGGGGGGAGSVGSNANTGTGKAGNGGSGIQNNILGEISGRYYAAGGGGGSYTDSSVPNIPGFGGGVTMTYSTSSTTTTNAGAGDGGNNGYNSTPPANGFGSSGFDATPNTGSGGGGGSYLGVIGGKGGLGVVIIKFSTF